MISTRDLIKKNDLVKFGTDVRIFVNLDFLTVRNPNVWSRRLWGSDPYADKSDLVAGFSFFFPFFTVMNKFIVLMHSGYFIPHFPYPSEIHGLLVTIRILQPQPKYPSVTNYYIRSQDGSNLKRGDILFAYSIEEVKQVLPASIAPLMQFGKDNDPWFVYSIALLADGFLDPVLDSDTLDSSSSSSSASSSSSFSSSPSSPPLSTTSFPNTLSSSLPFPLPNATNNLLSSSTNKSTDFLKDIENSFYYYYYFYYYFL
jgi:hypothetical protein